MEGKQIKIKHKTKYLTQGALYVELAAVMIIAMLLGGAFFDFALGIRSSVNFADHITSVSRHLSISSDGCKLSCDGVIDMTNKSFNPLLILSDQKLKNAHSYYLSKGATFQADIDWPNLTITMRGSIPANCVLCNTITKNAIFSSVSRVRIENQNCSLITC